MALNWRSAMSEIWWIVYRSCGKRTRHVADYDGSRDVDRLRDCVITRCGRYLPLDGVSYDAQPTARICKTCERLIDKIDSAPAVSTGSESGGHPPNGEASIGVGPVPCSEPAAAPGEDLTPSLGTAAISPDDLIGSSPLPVGFFNDKCDD